MADSQTATTKSTRYQRSRLLGNRRLRPSRRHSPIRALAVPLMSAHRDRNQRIFHRVMTGDRMSLIALDHQITYKRVEQIFYHQLRLHRMPCTEWRQKIGSLPPHEICIACADQRKAAA